MKITYFANQIYQYSYALPIYKKMGGTFIAKSLKRYFQFVKYLKNTSRNPATKTLFNTPPVRFCTVKWIHRLEGCLISASNAPIHAEHSNCTTIFVGHGTGDKPYGPNVKLLNGYDYHFISGPKHLEKLKDVGLDIPEEKLVKIGNPRFDDYINGKISRAKELDRLGIIDRDRMTVLYAPTWAWGNGTLHKYVYSFSKTMSREYNLIVRPHHHDRKYLPKINRWLKDQNIEHVYLSNPASLVQSDTMNDFAVSDILISDTSSILYEYLITKKPIIVIQNDYDELHHMPSRMDIKQLVDIYNGSQDILKLIEQNLENQKRIPEYEEYLHNCFYFNDGKSVERIFWFLNGL